MQVCRWYAGMQVVCSCEVPGQKNGYAGYAATPLRAAGRLVGVLVHVVLTNVGNSRPCQRVDQTFTTLSLPCLRMLSCLLKSLNPLHTQNGAAGTDPVPIWVLVYL